MDTGMQMNGKTHTKILTITAAVLIIASCSLLNFKNSYALDVVYEDHFNNQRFLYDDFDGPVSICGQEITLSAIENMIRHYDYVLYEDGSWTLKFTTFSTYIDSDGNTIAKSKAVTDEFGFSDGIHHDNGNSIRY